MVMERLKKGVFRWRRNFRHLPERDILLKELKHEFLVNRLQNVIWRYIVMNKPFNVELIRVREWEFLYIIHFTHHFVSIEIIQKEPFEMPNYDEME